MDRLHLRRKLDDFRAGQVCATIANCVPRDGRPLAPEDFFSSLREIVRGPMTPTQVRSRLRDISAFLNA
jgi:hypothetical protein